MLMAFILFTVGTSLGSNFLPFIGKWGLTIGKGEFLAPIGALMAFAIPIGVVFAASWLLAKLTAANESADKRNAKRNPLLQILNTSLTMLVLIFMVGSLGGLGILGGGEITAFADTLRPNEVSGFGSWLVEAGATLVWSVGTIAPQLTNSA
jgi:hypothetical protein